MWWFANIDRGGMILLYFTAMSGRNFLGKGDFESKEITAFPSSLFGLQRRTDCANDRGGPGTENDKRERILTERKGLERPLDLQGRKKVLFDIIKTSKG